MKLLTGCILRIVFLKHFFHYFFPFELAISDGTVDVLEDYACVDRYVIRNPGESAEMSEPIAFRCMPGNPVKEEEEKENDDEQEEESAKSQG